MRAETLSFNDISFISSAIICSKQQNLQKKKKKKKINELMAGKEEKVGKYKGLHESLLFYVIRITRKDQICK